MELNCGRYADKFVKNLTKACDLTLDDKGKLCWKKDGGFTGQEKDRLREALRELFEKKHCICSVAIKLKEFKEDGASHIILLNNKGKVYSHLIKNKHLGAGLESKVFSFISKKSKKNYAVKISRTALQIIKRNLKSSNEKKPMININHWDTSSLRKRSARYGKNIINQENLIKEMGAVQDYKRNQKKRPGLPTVQKLIVPIVHLYKEIFFKEKVYEKPEVSLMCYGEQYDSDASEMSIHKWPVEKIIYAYEQLLQALAALHANSYFLGDIKPQNILIKNNDFSMRFNDFCGSDIIHSKNYVSEEEFQKLKILRMSEKKVLIAAAQNLDIFSFGASLYEMLAGKVLFLKVVDSSKESYEGRKERIRQNLERVLKDCVIEIPKKEIKEIIEVEKRPQILKGLVEMISLMCHPEPEKRPDAATVLKKLQELSLYLI